MSSFHLDVDPVFKQGHTVRSLMGMSQVSHGVNHGAEQRKHKSGVGSLDCHGDWDRDW